MKSIIYLSALAVGIVSCDTAPKEVAKVNLEDESNKLSYSLGVIWGEEIKNSKENFDFYNDTAFMEAFMAASRGEELRIDSRVAGENLNAHTSKKRDSQMNENIEKSAAYFEENGSKEGVVTLENGLQYEILTEGTGAIPVEADRVLAHYHGTLIDGTVFDSSVDRGEPVPFGVTEVIPGWTYILQQMPVGSKWRVSIPYNLAYGAQGGGPIPPYSALIFEMEVLEIVK